MSTESLQFVSGLPRSGTTLLANLLGQNPAHHVTPTSGLIHLVRSLWDTWPEIQEFKAEGIDTVRSSVVGGLRGLMLGYYMEPLAEQRIVFDKSRGWLAYLAALDQILNRPVRVITLVRDIRAIVASFESAFQRSGPEYFESDRYQALAAMSAEQRALHTLADDQVTGRAIARLRGIYGESPERLILIPYVQLTATPCDVLAAIHGALGLPEFSYDPDHVRQRTWEDDRVNGLDLHRIRPRVEPAPLQPWQGVLPDELCDELARSYADINRLAAGPLVAPAIP